MGFNIKFKIETEYNQDVVDNIFTPYSSISDIVQIKFKTLQQSLIYQKKTIQRIKEIYNGELIIHLKTKDINNNEILNELTWFVENVNDNCKFVVHICEDFSLYVIYRLVNILKFNQTLLLENDKSIKNKNEYINKLNILFKNNNSSNVKICLDFGHLLFSEDCQRQEDIVNYLLMNEYFIKNIELFHLHDFNKDKDHLNLLTGNLSYSVVNKLLLIKETTPIILEVNLKDIDKYCTKEIEKFYLNFI